MNSCAQYVNLLLNTNFFFIFHYSLTLSRHRTAAVSGKIKRHSQIVFVQIEFLIYFLPDPIWYPHDKEVTDVQCCMTYLQCGIYCTDKAYTRITHCVHTSLLYKNKTISLLEFLLFPLTILSSFISNQIIVRNFGS